MLAGILVALPVDCATLLATPLGIKLLLDDPIWLESVQTKKEWKVTPMEKYWYYSQLAVGTEGQVGTLPYSRDHGRNNYPKS